jgi:carboxypeptidase PM20D1
MKKLLLIIVFFIISIFGILSLFNTVTVFSRQLDIKSTEPLILTNESEILYNLSIALKIPLFSSIDDNNQANFQQFKQFLKASYPLVHNSPDIKQRIISGSSIIYKCNGRDSRLKPILLISRIAVDNPSDNSKSKWTHEPFSGKIDAGFFWGAGTISGKSNAISIMEALESLLKNDLILQRSIYIAFIKESEQSSKNYQILSEVLKKEELDFEMILGAESHIVEGKTLGVSKNLAFVNCAERKTLKAIIQSENAEGLREKVNEFKLNGSIIWSGHASSQFIKTLTPELNFVDKWLICNYSFFGSLVSQKLIKDPIISNMLLSSTTKSISNNKAEITFYISPDEKTENIKKIVNQSFKKFELEWLEDEFSRKISPCSGYSYELLQTSIKQIIGDVIVLPSIGKEPSYNRYFNDLSPNIYQFSPWIIDSAEMERYQNKVDERVSVKQYLNSIRFYKKLIMNTLI